MFEEYIGKDLGYFAAENKELPVKVGYKDGSSYFYCGSHLYDELNRINAYEQLKKYHKVGSLQASIHRGISDIPTLSEYVSNFYEHFKSIPSYEDYQKQMDRKLERIRTAQESLNRETSNLLVTPIEIREIVEIYESIEDGYCVLVKGGKQSPYWTTPEYEEYADISFRSEYRKAKTARGFLKKALSQSEYTDYSTFIATVEHNFNEILKESEDEANNSRMESGTENEPN